MSPSALLLDFKHVTTLSPHQYQKRLRLREAWWLMVCEEHEPRRRRSASGYEYPSQFGGEYRRLFGAPPRKDVAALRPEAVPT